MKHPTLSLELDTLLLHRGWIIEQRERLELADAILKVFNQLSTIIMFLGYAEAVLWNI